MALFIWHGDMRATFPGVQNADHSTLSCAPGEIVELDHDPGISRLVPYEPAASPVEGETPEATAEQVAALEAELARLAAEQAAAEPAPEVPAEPAPEPPAEEAPPA